MQTGAKSLGQIHFFILGQTQLTKKDKHVSSHGHKQMAYSVRTGNKRFTLKWKYFIICIKT